MRETQAEYEARIKREREDADRKKRRDEADEQSRRNAQTAYNIATGDMLNTGIPGGLDCDVTTPM